MLNVFSIVIQQFPDIRHHRTLIGIVERNQRRRAGVLHLLLLSGVPDAGDRLYLHRTLYFKTGISWQEAMLWYSCSSRSIHCSRDHGATVRGDFRLFSS